MQLPRHPFATEPECEYVIRTVAPRFIGRFDPDMQGGEILVPEVEGVPIVVEQWIDPRPEDVDLGKVIAEVMADHFARGDA